MRWLKTSLLVLLVLSWTSMACSSSETTDEGSAGSHGRAEVAQAAADEVAQSEMQEKAEAEKKEEPANPLMDPKSKAMNMTAPATYKVKFETSKGDVVIQVTREWSPHGADRFYNLVQNGFYDEVRFFRVVANFMAQFGINGDPKIQTHWANATITDDPQNKSNLRGFVTFARTGAPNSRSTQIFINYKNNSYLDKSGFTPFGEVIDGMDVVDALYSEYGDGPPGGRGPNQGKIQMEGNAYLNKEFEKLDYIKKATIVKK